MKKLLLLTVLIFNINSVKADDGNKNLILIMYGGALALPVMAFAAPIGLAAIVPKKIYEDAENRRLENNMNDNKLHKFYFCNALKKIYLDADITPVYSGLELSNQSNVETASNVNEILPNFKSSHEPYLCVNPKKSKIYPNGCLDTLNKKSTSKIKGKWYLNKIFTYHKVEFAQLKNKNGETAFTDIASTLKHGYYNDKKISIFNQNLKNTKDNIKKSISINCKIQGYK